jgi:hypothetical protein
VKKRILFISVVMALLLSLVAPAVAFAKPNKVDEGGKFSAHATMWVSKEGNVSVTTGSNGQMIMKTIGEEIEGVFYQTDWDEAQGATLKVKHNSKVTLFPNGWFSGTSTEVVKVNLNNNEILVGSSTTAIVGKYHLDQTWGIYCDWVTDTGIFSLSGHETSAKGIWSAKFLPSDDTLYCNDAVFTGTYSSR